MNIAGRIPAVGVEIETDLDLRAAIAEFREKHPSAVIEWIDEAAVMGMCEICAMPVTVDQESWCDENGVQGHVSCPEGAS